MKSARLCLAALAFASGAVVADAIPARIAAASQTALDAADCKALGDFYWEIGDGNGALAGGSIGTRYGADTPVKVASASKLVWAAYVLQKLDRDPDANQTRLLRMESGYTAFKPFSCLLSRTVADCLAARGNGELQPENVGRFHYNGGHDQKLAVALGLGGANAAQLTQEVQRVLGGDLGMRYAVPQLAGGIESTPAAYARLLRRILRRELRVADYLGWHAVCTLPGTCPTAAYSPVKEAWHYSLNHWIEDAPGTGDGAFSSPGLEGFYPWISADRRFYGLVGRQQLRATAAWDSVRCGRGIRKAFVTAAAQQ